VEHEKGAFFSQKLNVKMYRFINEMEQLRFIAPNLYFIITSFYFTYYNV